MKLRDEILDRQKAAEDYLSNKRVLWDEMEALFHNQLPDNVSSKQKSQVQDPKLSTLILERAYRVMAQLAVGKVRGISKNDRGVEKLMNMTLDKYVVPNANSQFDFLTKMRMMDIYSNLYGNFFAMVDWAVKKNGYIGPDFWLLNIRDVFPQVGAVSLEDSDYVINRTWQPISYFESLKGKTGFKNISEVLTKLKDNSGSKQSKAQSAKSKREGKEYPQEMPAKNAGYFEVLSQYEGDRWVDFCVDADLEFRDIPNPHENGELPVICKYSIPLLDDFMGMGDMERGKTMQNVVNSVWNLYLDAVKMSIFPPVLINKDWLTADSNIKWGAAEKWLGRGPLQNAVQPIQLSPQGIATFNNTYAAANGSLLNLFGTTDTTVTQNNEAGFGKTPEALKMQGKRENTRDAADRFYMEQFNKQLMTKFANLLAIKQEKPISVRLFGPEIEELVADYPELQEYVDETKGNISIDKGKMKSIIYDYEIVSGSTYAVDQETQQTNMMMLLQLLMKDPNLIQTVAQEGFQIKLGELFKRIVSNAGIQDWDKIVVEMKESEKLDMMLQQQNQQFLNAVQQMQSGGSMNQIPPEGGQGMPPQGMPQPQQPPMPQQPASPIGGPPQMGGMPPYGQ